MQNLELQSAAKIKQVEARIDAIQEAMNRISEEHAEKKDRFQDRLQRIREGTGTEKKQDATRGERESQTGKGGKQSGQEEKGDVRDVILKQIRQSPNAAKVEPAQMNMLLQMLAEILAPPPPPPAPFASQSGSTPSCPMDALLQSTSGRPDVIPAQMIGQPPPASAALSRMHWSRGCTNKI